MTRLCKYCKEPLPSLLDQLVSAASSADVSDFLAKADCIIPETIVKFWYVTYPLFLWVQVGDSDSDNMQEDIGSNEVSTSLTLILTSYLLTISSML